MAGRKSNGEGTWYQTSEGTWVYQITTTNESGEKYRKSFSGKTKKIVKEKYKAFQEEQETIQHKIEMGLSPLKSDLEKQSISLTQWVFDWIQLYKKPKVKATTYASYMQMWGTHIKPFFGELPLASITNQDMQTFYNFKLREGRLDGKGGLSPKSIRNLHVMLHSALQKAVGKIILVNPAEDTDRPTVSDKEMRVLTAEEMQIFMREINTERLRAAMFLSLFTGIRMGELLALTWDDVDFKKKAIRISKDYVRVPVYNEDGSKAGTKLIVQETPKSKKSVRTIPVQQDVFAMLLLQKHDQESHKRYNPLNLVFPSKVGTHTDPRTYQKRIIAVSKRCEIQHVNVHALRHTFATRLVELQVPLKIIQELLGHASVTTTMKYTHALDEEKEKAVGSMDSLLPTAQSAAADNKAASKPKKFLLPF